MIIKNIIASLQVEDSVYVNDVGLFQKTFSPSQTMDGNIVPPRYSVALDTKVEGSGFAFIIFVSKQEQMRIVDADVVIREWVAQLMDDLKKNKRVTFPSFGTFSMQKNGILIFTADYIPELNVEFEGMESIELPPVIEKKKKVATKKIKPIAQPEIIAPIIEEKEDKTDEIEEITVSEQVQESEPDVVAPIIEEKENKTDEIEEVTAPEPIQESEPDVVAPIIEEKEDKREEIEDVTASESVQESEPEPDVVIPIIEGEGERREEIESETVVPIVDEDKPVIEDNNGHKSKKKSGIVLFIIVILLVVGMLCYLFKVELADLYNNIFNKEQQAAPSTEVTVPEETTIEDVATDTLLMEDTIMSLEPVENGQIVENDVTPALTAPVVQPTSGNVSTLPQINFVSGKYYVIHGSFGSEKDCLKHIQAHKFAKYSPQIVRQKDNYRMRICLKVCDTEAEANAFAANIKDAWVLK